MLFKLPESSESLSTSTRLGNGRFGEPLYVGSKRKVPDSSAQSSPAYLATWPALKNSWQKLRLKNRPIQIHELKIVWFVLIFPIIPAVAQPHISKGLHKLTHCPFEKAQRTSVMWSGIGVSARSKQQFLNGLIPHGAGSWSRKTFKGFPLNLCLDGIWIGVWSQIEVGFNMFQSIPE